MAEIDPKTRENMVRLLGQFDAIRFPLVGGLVTENQAYYDLLDSMHEQYVGILKDLWGFEDD
jgi:hypothetical protein